MLDAVFGSVAAADAEVADPVDEAAREVCRVKGASTSRTSGRRAGFFFLGV